MLENNNLINLMIKRLFGEKSIYFYNTFDYIELDEPGIKPDGVHLIDLNLNTDVLVTHVEEAYPEQLYININNRFAKLIYNNRYLILDKNKNLVKELFSYLRDESNASLGRIHDEQKIILKWLKSLNLVDEKFGSLLSEYDIQGSKYPDRSRSYL